MKYRHGFWFGMLSLLPCWCFQTRRDEWGMDMTKAHWLLSCRSHKIHNMDFMLWLVFFAPTPPPPPPRGSPPGVHWKDACLRHLYLDFAFQTQKLHQSFVLSVVAIGLDCVIHGRLHLCACALQQKTCACSRKLNMKSHLQMFVVCFYL